jgi:hypothetical protein
MGLREVLARAVVMVGCGAGPRRATAMDRPMDPAIDRAGDRMIDAARRGGHS